MTYAKGNWQGVDVDVGAQGGTGGLSVSYYCSMVDQYVWKLYMTFAWNTLFQISINFKTLYLACNQNE
jgi:hypothetical protein